jgi:hypothetical protein
MDKDLVPTSEIIHSVDDLLRLGDTLIKSGLLPKSIGTKEAAAAIVLKGRELGIGAMEALSSINVILGKPTTSPQLMLALARRTKELEDASIHDDGNTCTVTIKRKGQSPVVTSFSMEDAKAMNLIGKDNWTKQPKVMRQWRAVAANLRLSFPDAISGLYTFEEMGAEVEVNDEGAMTITKMPEVVQGETPKVVVEPPKVIPSEVVESHIQAMFGTKPKGDETPNQLAADTVKRAIASCVAEYPSKKVIYFKRNDPPGEPTSKQIESMKGLAASWLEKLAMSPKVITPAMKDAAEEYRRSFTKEVFGKNHMDEFTVDEIGGLLQWLALEKKEVDGKKTYIETEDTQKAKEGISAVITYLSEKMGQTKMAV